MLDAVQQYVAQYDAPVKDDEPDLMGQAANVLSTLYTFEPGEKLHTYLKLATPLSYCYKRATVAITANVAKATHGETRNETLGSGDASVPLQSFTLRQPPLTYVSANEPDGIESTLRVYVNSVEWHEAPAMVAMGSGDRGFTTRTDDNGNTSIIFGNGQHGARVPTGVANVTAIYRNGIGKAGNVNAGQITNLLSRPLGVKGVNNPIEAAGGADKETRDQARKNAPLAVMALDRLVGVQDYADFSRTFAGIAKAQSA
jgi:predicted phage baseplate assembly protein